MRRACIVVLSAVLAALPAAAQWSEDASRARIPGRPAIGRIHGKPFRVEKAELRMAKPSADMPNRTTYFLNLRQGREFFADQEYRLTLLTPRGRKIDGKSFVVTPEGVFKMPGAIKENGGSYPPVQGVLMTWKVPGKSFGETDMMSKFTMRLRFGKAKGSRIPGEVYIAMQDREKSWVSGTFTAVIER